MTRVQVKGKMEAADEGRPTFRRKAALHRQQRLLLALARDIRGKMLEALGYPQL